MLDMPQHVNQSSGMWSLACNALYADKHESPIPPYPAPLQSIIFFFSLFPQLPSAPDSDARGEAVTTSYVTSNHFIS